MPQRAHRFKINCCLKVRNARLNLALPISGYLLESIESLPEMFVYVLLTKHFLNFMNFFWDFFGKIVDLC